MAYYCDYDGLTRRDTRGLDGLGWITSHSLRKTVATILDEAALSAREVADQLEHSRPSMTQDVYLARGSGAGEERMHWKLPWRVP